MEFDIAFQIVAWSILIFGVILGIIIGKAL